MGLMEIIFLAKEVRDKGGVERILNYLIKKFSNSYNLSICARCNSCKLNLIKIPSFPFSNFLNEILFLFFSFFILRKRKNSIIFSFTPTLHQDIYRIGGAVYKFRLNMLYQNPLVRMLKLLFDYKYFLKILVEKRIFKNPNTKIIANSKMIKTQAVKAYNIPEKRIKIVYNGVDMKIFNISVKNSKSSLRREFGFSEDDFIILFVSLDFKRKGLKYLLSSLSLLKEEGYKFKLIVVGNGNTSKYKKFSEKLSLKKEVFFLGYFKEIEKIYAISDIFVLPTLYDPFSNATLEAMACGLPVITTIFNGASEIIDHGKNGFILDSYKDIFKLKDYIKCFFDKSFLEKASILAYEKAKLFDIENFYREILDVVKDVEGEKRLLSK